MLAAVILAPVGLWGQDGATDSLKERMNETADKVAGLEERLGIAETDIAGLKKLKISGYVQARYEYHDDARSGPVLGTASTSSANQGKLLNRFFVRRGRVKTTYQATPNALGVVYFDGSASGVSLKEAYVAVTEPRSKVTATLGQFNWLFGYEISFSSSKREFPERARWSRTLFPGERDRGIKVERPFLLMEKYNLLLQAGVYNGNGIEDASFGVRDPNKWKDIIARAAFGFSHLDFGLSGYWGKQFNPKDSASPLSPSTTDKIRYGADAQFFYELPALGGGVLKAEGVLAEEPKNQSKPFASRDTTRDVAGLNVVWAQNLKEKFQWVSRVDFYDPDKDIDKDHFITYGFGLIYFWDGASKIKLVYEIPKSFKNSRSGLTSAKEDEKDNILTLEWVYTF
ncbi:MAG: OprO/OprP family phosphate-selective porin [candidate division Zixibacteria bacterium]|nr:OprO/OprP family phosphate-selective porin [candidate division Zixibacteria bacterium]